MSAKELVLAKNNARSFPGMIAPVNIKEVGREMTSNDTFIYYKDDQGNYWYNTKRIAEFDKKMRDANLKRKRSKKIR